jgi:chromosome segregation ATPase
MELNDLTENYKNVIKEKERLKQNLQLFIDENKAAALHIKKIEKNLENYQKNAQNIMQDKDYLNEELNKSQKINQDLNDQLLRLKAQLSAAHLQKKNLQDKDKKSLENDINISNENFINALNKQIARLKSDNKNLEIKNKKLSEEKINNLQAIKNLENEVLNMKSSQDMGKVEQNINMNYQMNNLIQDYENQINELTNQVNFLQSENMSLQQNHRSLMSSKMDSREYPRSDIGGDDNPLKPNQL